MARITDFARLEREMRRLALAAGEAIMEVWRSGEFGTTKKADESPVTAADFAADAIIAEGLRGAFPGVPLVTEEQPESHDQTASTFLIVDPLDGTREFARRGGDFTVNIAYVEAGVPIRGVVFAPVRRRLWITQADGTAVEEGEGAPRPLRAAVADNGALRAVVSMSHRHPATDEYLARYAIAEAKSAGSSLKFCLVAAGEADLYLSALGLAEL